MRLEFQDVAFITNNQKGERQMESTKLLKHVVKSNKKSINHTFNVLMSLEEQIEKMVIPYLENYEIPVEKRKHIDKWIHHSRESRNSYQKLIEDCFETLELYF